MNDFWKIKILYHDDRLKEFPNSIPCEAMKFHRGKALDRLRELFHLQKNPCSNISYSSDGRIIGFTVGKVTYAAGPA